MASKPVTLNPRTYTELDTSAGSALDCQNVSNSIIRVRYSATQPTSGGYVLYPGQGIARNGHTDSMWAICLDSVTAEVEVGE